VLPLIARLLLDAQASFLAIADAMPAEARDDAPAAGLNTPGWIVAHAGFIHDVWMNVDAQGLTGDACEPWLRAWFRRQREAGATPIDAPFEDARAALDRVVPKATAFIESLTDASLGSVPDFEEGAWPAGTTVGYLVARDIAHLFAHASELNVIVTLAGGPDAGLPGRMTATRG